MTEGEKRRREIHRFFSSLTSSVFPNLDLLNLKNKNKGGFAETERRRVTFPEIPSLVLEHVCQYFYYKLQYSNA